MTYQPPFTQTSFISEKLRDILRLLGRLEGQQIPLIPLALRRTNSIRAIQSSLAIEGNTLSIDQVTALFEGKPILGTPREILEVRNALTVYDQLNKYNGLEIEDFLGTHHQLMRDLIPENGQWRTGGVGVFRDQEVVHMAPPAKRVAGLMQELFHFIKTASALPWLLKACICHYEIEFIHPFADGNGRMGRLWQQVLLMKEDPIFEFIPVEVLIKKKQQTYYDVLQESGTQGDSAPFVAFSLDLIYQALEEFSRTVSRIPKDYTSRLAYAKSRLEGTPFSRKDYMDIHPEISSATASRDLSSGVKENILKNTGEKNQTRYIYVE